MITDAILEMPGRQARLVDIYSYMVRNYPYFRDRNTNDKERRQWQNSVRHNLSSQRHKDYFLRKPNEEAFNGAAGGYWTLHPKPMEEALNPKPDKRKEMANRRNGTPGIGMPY